MRPKVRSTLSTDYFPLVFSEYLEQLLDCLKYQDFISVLGSQKMLTKAIYYIRGEWPKMISQFWYNPNTEANLGATCTQMRASFEQILRPDHNSST